MAANKKPVVLGRDAFLARKRKRELVELSDGAYIYVQALGARDLRDAQGTMSGENATTAEGMDATVRVCIAAVVDENGDTIFDSGDEDLVAEQTIGDLNLIAMTALRLSGVETENEENAEGKEDDPLET
jgi:hypothetical protein